MKRNKFSRITARYKINRMVVMIVAITLFAIAIIGCSHAAIETTSRQDKETASGVQPTMEMTSSDATNTEVSDAETSSSEETNTEATTTTNLEPIPYVDDLQLYAVAYVGYMEIEDLDFYKDKYIGDKEIPTHVFSDGEYYLIIPRYDDMHLSLYRNDMETMGKTLIYECEACGPFVIKCNISDIFPDVMVGLTYKGETVEFSPYISLKDGSVVVGDRGLNLTRWAEE
ncbi:MAG: hypothetical protein IJW18_07745 [Lachnospiraceae bacterium]|nr:hypothetical protein [Lachnospiraceae bacterium]